jgi:hypothetical protein
MQAVVQLPAEQPMPQRSRLREIPWSSGLGVGHGANTPSCKNQICSETSQPTSDVEDEGERMEREVEG